MSFEKDFKEITRIIEGVVRHNEENDAALDKQLIVVSEIFSDFNKKYPKLEIAIEKKIDHIWIKLMINDSLKNVFDNASKIPGLNAIGISGFNEVSVGEADQYTKTASMVTTKAYISYTLDIGNETLVIYFDEKSQKTILNYETASLKNKLTPQYMILEMYSEVGEDIDFMPKCYTLGFIDKEDEVVYKWEDEFYPKMLE